MLKNTYSKDFGAFVTHIVENIEEKKLHNRINKVEIDLFATTLGLLVEDDTSCKKQSVEVLFNTSWLFILE